ncbi:MAG: tyrosine-type recombinase/integrase [Planctomycetaceae bacterium]|nr:tyrosine-type recombinase/integrase [Planctomycetaceae bacterium]
MAYTVSLFQPPITRKKKDGTKYKTKGEVWWLAWRDTRGKLYRKSSANIVRLFTGESIGIKNKRIAQQYATRLEERFAQGEFSLTGTIAEEKRRPLTEHYTDYEKVVLAREGTADHKADTINRVKKIIDGCGWKSLDDIKKGRFEAWLGEQKTKTGQPIGRETKNRYIWALMNFAAYLVENGRLKSNPLPGLKKAKKKDKDRKYRRIPLTWEHVVLLLKSVEESTITRRGLTPLDRSVLYRLAIMTGYRRGALRKLRVRDFQLDGDQPTVILPADAAKNGSETPPTGLGVELAGILRRYVSYQELGPDDHLFARLPDRTAEVLQADLEAAGLPTVDGQGRVVDFHALRYTYNHLLSSRGVDLGTRQKLMHHSTPELTANTYAPVVDVELIRASASLPGVPTISDSILPPAGCDSGVE